MIFSFIIEIRSIAAVVLVKPNILRRCIGRCNSVIASSFLIMQMEFSFGPRKWLPKESLHERQEGSENYALGLHVPGFFDKVLNVDKCLLQSDPANKVYSF